MRDAGANETSGTLGSALGRTLVGVSQLRIPWSDPLIESAIFFTKDRLSCVVGRWSIEDCYQLLHELAGGM